MLMDSAVEESDLYGVTRSVVRRWGVEMPDTPRDIQRAIKIALRDAASVAGKTPFECVYPEDHSWLGGGMRGITMARLRDDSAHSGHEKASDQWGVAASITGFERAILVPIAYDLSQETAAEVVRRMQGSEGVYLDLSEVSGVLADEDDQDEAEEIAVRIFAANWTEIRDLAADNSCLALKDAVHFRRPVAWDLLRARMSGADCPALPAFDENEFERRRILSVRHDRREIDGAREMLQGISQQDHDLLSSDGLDWFSVMIDCLQSIGKGHSFEGLSVIVHFQSLKLAEGEDPNLPVDFARFDFLGLRNVCVAYGLDPVQASFLEDLAERDPHLFVDFSAEETRYEPIAVSVVPDMHLSMIRATSSGRDEEAYQRLVAASAEALAA